MSNLKWVAPTKRKEERALNLRAFFEVAHLGILDDLCIPGIAYRQVGDNSKNDYALAAWAQKARIESRKIEVSAINVEKLQSSIPAIRALTIQKPDFFCDKLQRLLNECGIAIVFLPHIGGSFLHGATFIEGNRIVIGLTVRGRDADRFWFSLFHELYHILAGHIFNLNQEEPEIERENKANQYARDTLIPYDKYKRFVDRGCINRTSIIQFASSIEVDPGIVVGRLQKEKVIPYTWFNDLKTQYIITAS